LAVENPNDFEWQKGKCESFNHSLLGAEILGDEIVDEHPATLDTVLSRTHACCHFERSGAESKNLVCRQAVPPFNPFPMRWWLARF